MVETILLATVFVAFFCTFLVLPYWIKRAKENKLVGKDMHKKDKREVAERGGITVIFGFSLGVLLYIGLNTFYFKNTTELTKIFALLCVIIFGSMVGMVDDVLGWKKGLNRKSRVLMVLFSAIPLMAINAGMDAITFPFLGTINTGLLYPLLIIPLGIVGATTTFNFLAGYNGLESSQGIIILLGMTLATYLTGNSWLSIIALCMVASLFAFYIFNRYPAKVFPGDIMTYSVGALIAGITILGNIEKVALIFFIPYIIETVLKVRGRLKKESFARLNKNGGLEMPYDKIYGLEHLSIYILKKMRPKKEVTESQVVYLINGFQILIVLIGILFFL